MNVGSYANSNVFPGYNQMGILTKNCLECGTIWPEQQRDALQSLHWLVFIFTSWSDLPVSLDKMCICFCDVMQVQAVLKRKEEEDQQMQQLIQALQASLEKEKSKVKDLKEQVISHFSLFI